MQSEALPDAINRLLALSAHNPSMNAVRSTTRFAGEIHDFCVPVNPYFPPPHLLHRLTQRLPDLLKHYPDYAVTHEQHIADLVRLPAENVVVANGSTEIITALCRHASGPILTTVPTFGRWTDLPVEWGKALHTVMHQKAHGWQIDAATLIEEVRRCKASTLVLCNPNNPTGAFFPDDDIGLLIRSLPQLESIIIDESFLDFSNLCSAQSLALQADNVIVVKSLGKALGWHGMRLGYAVANTRQALALRQQMPWWNINGVAAFVLSELAHCGVTQRAYHASFERIARDRRYLAQRLRSVSGLTVYPSQANFLYVELPEGVSGRAVRGEMLEQHGLFVRECSNKLGSSESYLRIAVLPARAADSLTEALGQFFSGVGSA